MIAAQQQNCRFQQTSGAKSQSCTSLFPSASDLPERLQILTDALDALRRDHAKIQQAIFEAAQVQRRLCSPRELTWGDYEAAGEIFPVRHLSGDFFKITEFASAIGLTLGDIAGKGLTAGIWQAHLMALVERSTQQTTDPAKVASEVNRELCRRQDETPIMALFFARVDRKGNLHYCNAGLPSPLLLRRDHTVECLQEGGPLLGALKDAQFQTGKCQLGPGDMLVAYSDGVTECRNRADQEFESRRLTDAAKGVQGSSAGKALFALLAGVLDFAGSCSPDDDMTLLVLRHRGSGRAPSHFRKRNSVPLQRPDSAYATKHVADGGTSPDS